MVFFGAVTMMKRILRVSICILVFLASLFFVALPASTSEVDESGESDWTLAAQYAQTPVSPDSFILDDEDFGDEYPSRPQFDREQSQRDPEFYVVARGGVAAGDSFANFHYKTRPYDYNESEVESESQSAYQANAGAEALYYPGHFPGTLVSFGLLTNVGSMPIKLENDYVPDLEGKKLLYYSQGLLGGAGLRRKGAFTHIKGGPIWGRLEIDGQDPVNASGWILEYGVGIVFKLNPSLVIGPALDLHYWQLNSEDIDMGDGGSGQLSVGAAMYQLSVRLGLVIN